MGIFRKLFGKKEKDTDNLLNFDQTMPSDQFGMEEKPFVPETGSGFSKSFQSAELPSHLEEPSFGRQNVEFSQRDVELINSKLDMLKAILNSMDQRIANLERAAGVEQKKNPW